MLLLLLFVVGCGESVHGPATVVTNYLSAEGPASCQYLTETKARDCRRPRVPEPPADAVVIERVRVDGDQATIRASYDWTGYRRHSTFVLVRRANDWLIAAETPE